MPAISFQLYVWPQRLLMLAPGYGSTLHRHHLAQLAFGLDGPVVFESAQGGMQHADLLLIPPDVAHAHPAFGPSAVLYLEPESADWAAFHGRGSTDLSALPFDPRLRAIARRAAAASDAVAAQTLVDRLIGDRAASDGGAGDDVLVAQVCELVRHRLDAGPITLAALARAVHRSPSRLAHRFRSTIGVPLRRYVLWSRLRVAAEAALRGASLTEAAHAAGFADSAHLSRTFRASFGIAPSFLFQRGRFGVTFCESAPVRPPSAPARAPSC